MINIVQKDKCTACQACFNICPKNAISMIYDNEGFLYPKVNMELCVNCGLCSKVCPINKKRKYFFISPCSNLFNPKNHIETE